MIDKDSGSLKISESILIKPNDTFDEISGLALGEVQEVTDHKNGYKWLKLKNVEMEGQYFLLGLCFFDNRLKLLDFVVDNQKFDLNSTWDDWNEVEERNNVSKYREWIRKELGREGQFEWGGVGATYDNKRGSSFIFIKYY
ncbi:MAG TPA: hypothetical protein VF602_12290 [Pedobacter sp.]|jgi:hypothetical protein